jgi:hypothetical protein
MWWYLGEAEEHVGDEADGGAGEAREDVVEGEGIALHPVADVEEEGGVHVVLVDGEGEGDHGDVVGGRVAEEQAAEGGDLGVGRDEAHRHARPGQVLGEVDEGRAVPRRRVRHQHHMDTRVPHPKSSSPQQKESKISCPTLFTCALISHYP